MSKSKTQSESDYPTEGPNEHDPDTYPQEWINYGDVNPEIHGGMWVKRDGSMWQVVHNRNLKEDGPEGMIQDGKHQMIETYWFEPQDVWIDGDPDKGFTDGFKKSFSGRMRNPIHTRDMGYIVQEIAQGLPFNVHSQDSYTDDLESYLSDHFGIELDD